MIKLIACIDKYNSLGINGDLIYRIKEDLKIFKEKTIGNTVVMGRNTFESINKIPLPNRKNVIISKTLPQPKDGSYTVLKNIEDVFNIKHEGDLCIIGGQHIFNYFSNHYDELHLSIIRGEYTKNYDISKAVKFNMPDVNNFNLISRDEYEMFYIEVYKRLS